ncbi:hypothetical protein ABFS82_02G059100 [Erythranthe guttata]|uniref:Uncharacterized protein n=1 Tax=Erythranthe guttata TaxID=4155 RepID=A0A022PUJ6_ERYGU|nr:PREDICTED: uncharacterized protein LOC105949604 [Erythranthe guttata]EYU18473.1 hypothetical protein MIMGU_mgv1a025704mg [Erythranthe guttata]|eukprot:XP_012828361.1 PREDICTED: uncharacterized protein LOC105949604 [Erythranthe guttata]
MGSSSSSSTIAPLLLRNLVTAIFIHANKSLISFSHKYKFLELLRCFIVSVFLFFLGLLPSFFSCLSPSQHNEYSSSCPNFTSRRDDDCYGGGSGVSRALSQLLSIMNDIPVSSRKYEVVRSLAEKLIDENLLENNRALREVNCSVLSVAFARSLSQLEAALAEQGRRSSGDGAGDSAAGEGDLYDCSGKGSRLMKGVKYYGVAAWRYAKSRSSEMRRCSGEKLAAELLWLAQKMAASGCAEEAVCKWASASNLAWLALSAEPRLQGSLVKVSAFLIKQAKEMGKEEEEEEKEDQETNTPSEEQHIRQTKMKMLMSWLPLLCRANNGTDAPILSMGERAEMERILEAIISTLREEDEQECVLSLWLHHFTYCPASDWPNLRSCYTRWYSVTRARLVLSSV